MRRGRIARGALAGAALSGAPSTAWALARGGDPLAAARAAGALLTGGERGAAVQLAAAVPVHLGISLLWTVVLARVLPERRTVAWGAAAGVGIAALDLGVGRRRLAPIRALPIGPQIADHVAFGALVAAVLRGARPPGANAAPSAGRRRAG